MDSAANSLFRGSRQHDAQEFLRFILSHVDDHQHEVMKKAEAEKDQPHARINSSSKRRRIASKAKAASGQTAIEDTFQGRLAYETRCFECESVSKREETFMDLSLPVSAERSQSLAVCFEQWELKYLKPRES